MSLGEYLGAGSSTTKLLWHLNGDSSDSSGNGNNGTDTSIDYGFTYGRFGQGALTNALTDGIVKSTDLGINGNGAITISQWIKLTADITSGTWFFSAHRSTNGADRYISVGYEYNGGTRRLSFDASNSITTYNITLGTSQWYNIIQTRESGASPAVNLYLNGNKILSGTGGISTIGQNLFALGFPAASLTPSAYHDEIIVENVVWSAEKVRKYYTWAKGRFGI